MDLWITTAEHKLALFTDDCANCQVPQTWNDTLAGATTKTVSDKTDTEQCYVYSGAQDGKKVIKNEFHGTQL